MSGQSLAHSIPRLMVPVVVALVFALGRKYLPIQSRERSAYEGISAAGISPYITVGTAMTVLCTGFANFFALRGLNRLLAHTAGFPERVVLPGNYAWLISSILVSLCFAYEITLQLWGMLNDRQAIENYRRWSDRKAGFRASSLLRWMSLVIALPAFVANLLVTTVYASFQHDKVLIGRYAHVIPETHSYASVKRFVVVKGYRDRGGLFHSQPTVLLEFEDGKKWDSWELTESNVLDQSFVDYLAGKLGRAPEQLLTERQL